MYSKYISFYSFHKLSTEKTTQILIFFQWDSLQIQSAVSDKTESVFSRLSKICPKIEQQEKRDIRLSKFP